MNFASGMIFFKALGCVCVCERDTRRMKERERSNVVIEVMGIEIYVNA